MAPVVRDTAEADGRQLPGVVVVDLGHGHLELVADPAGNGLQDPPLAFEGHVLRQAEADPGDADIHEINCGDMRPVPGGVLIFNLSSLHPSVKRGFCWYYLHLVAFILVSAIEY